MLKQSSSFTLIEMLIVIAIIGSLSALLVPNMMAARDKAWDAQKKSDLKQIQKALEMYNQDKAQYIPTLSFPAIDTCWSSGANCTGTIYMKKMPKDQKRSGNQAYYYLLDTTDSSKYTLCACLENKADPDKTSGNCSADASYICNSGVKYILTEP